MPCRWKESTPEYKRKHNVAYRKRKVLQHAFIKSMKLEAGCLECGYRAFSEALEFDHVKGKKLFEITKMLGLVAWPKLLAEIAKCEIVCANCHRVRSAIRRPPGGYQKET